ncbi:HutD family protein [Caulobacter sp. CCG-8]|uniref:HutD/Ves family protein n=1 Tax=Caulobacter sp. CCG-8 TaxID=3127958 RepID=UPI00307ED1E3
MRVLRAADRIATPWKNGGGVTREVAAWPSGADLDGFEWRISLAEIAADGPFSTFPGVDRVLTVIQGEGLLLTVDDRMLALDAASPPLDFPGEARVAARLTDGPISDLNVMVRRGAWRARTRRLTVTGASDVAAKARVTLVLALDPLRIVRPGGAIDLSPLDAVVLEHGHSRLSLEGRGRTLICEITVDPEHIQQ